jgi:hypothetical protein
MEISKENPTKTEDLFQLSVEEYRAYMLPKFSSWSVGGALTGAAVGYYVGEKMALCFYNYGLMSGLTSFTFFSGSFALRYFRQKDDIYNYLVAGSINGAALGSLQGARRGAMGFVIGGVFGGIYNVTTQWLYDQSREAWISNRRFTISNSVDRRLVRPKPAIPSNIKRETFSLFRSSTSPQAPSAAEASTDSIDTTKRS